MSSLRERLLAWYDRERRDLPWRRTGDPYAIWLSEVMLQQTQVATVIPYWHRFLERFPTVQALAAAPTEDVLTEWKGLGYYSRARNLHKAANAIVSRFGGRLPGTVEELLTLPGFGRYTSGAVASIAFAQEAPLVDGNVARLFSRLFEIDGPPGEKAREAALWREAERLVQGERPGDLNQSLMELGARICRPEKPSCLLCPVRDDCLALRHGRVDALPPAKVRAKPKAMTLALAVLRRKDRWLFARRAESGLFGGLWELPAVDVTKGDEGVEAGFQRVLEARVVVVKLLGELTRQLTHRTLTLQLFEVEGTGVPERVSSFEELRFCTAEEASKLGMSTAMNHALALALASGSADG